MSSRSTDARAPVRDALLELPAPPRGRRADVLHRDVEELGLRAVARVRPFLGAGRARARSAPGRPPCRGRLRGVTLPSLVDLAPVDPVHERAPRGPARRSCGPGRRGTRSCRSAPSSFCPSRSNRMCSIDGVVVPQVVRGVLEVRLDLAGVGVDGDDAVGVEVVALADVAVEVGRRVAGPVVQEVRAPGRRCR